MLADEFTSLVAGLLYNSNCYEGSPSDVDVQKSLRQNVPDIKNEKSIK